ncbi:hypothetical protein E3J51_04090 [Candidatus Bathyarchaeota archaeon]|nr:MAG: hypothetical protein E3J51_04090 [Candidatus Bathyarchaeota archaeon]
MHATFVPDPAQHLEEERLPQHCTLRIAYSQFIIFKQQEPYVKYVANSDQMVVYDGNPIMCDATDGAITVVSESAWLLIAVLALAALLMPLLRRRRTNKDIHKWFDAVSK